jgi:hypothetical protein
VREVRQENEHLQQMADELKAWQKQVELKIAHMEEESRAKNQWLAQSQNEQARRMEEMLLPAVPPDGADGHLSIAQMLPFLQDYDCQSLIVKDMR